MTKEQPPKCNTCGQQMVAIGSTGQVIMFQDGDSSGVRSAILYQCPECKDVKID